MSQRWWDEEDDGAELAAPTVASRDDAVDDGALWDVRYPRPVEHAAPDGLGWRERRRWAHDARLRERAERNDTVRGWRAARPESARAGLGIIALLVAVAVAVVAFWPGDEPEPAAAPAPTGERATGPDSRGLPQERDRWTGEPAPSPDEEEVTGHDHGDAPEPPAGLFDDATGAVAYEFVLGYLTYTPSSPDPVDTWLAGWESTATGELVDTADTMATQVYGFTVADAVHVTDPRVLSGARDGDTWELVCSWALFPIGGDGDTPTTTQQVTVTLSATDGLVSGVEVTAPGSAA